MGRRMFVILLTLLLVFVRGICEGSPSRQKTAPEENTGTRVIEPVTVASRTDRDPYTESRLNADLPDKVELFFFYIQDCEICDELESFYEILSSKLPNEVRDTYPHMIYTINIVTTNGRQVYERVTDAMDLNRLTLSPPLLVAGGRIFQGLETISNNINEAFLTAGEDIFLNKRFYNPALRKTGNDLFADYSINSDHLTLVYFYRIVCPYCEMANPVIDDLPKTLVINGRDVPLDVIRINTRSGNNSERIIAFFEKYQVPDEHRTVPIVFFPGVYLRGQEDILRDLPSRLPGLAAEGENLLAELLPHAN